MLKVCFTVKRIQEKAYLSILRYLRQLDLKDLSWYTCLLLASQETGMATAREKRKLNGFST